MITAFQLYLCLYYTASYFKNWFHLIRSYRFVILLDINMLCFLYAMTEDLAREAIRHNNCISTIALFISTEAVLILGHA